MKYFLPVILIAISTSVFAQETLTTDSLAKYYDMSLEDLQKVKASGVSSELEKFLNSLMSVASQKTLSTRESPSIVSLITEEQIKKSGARDLIDVFRLVPGFDFAYDGNGKIGLGVRGNWVNEGKILLLMDGLLMNDIFSATLSFGNHFSVANISRIEIIRGPGSAIYGGFAELGVINIITKKGSELKGGYVNTTYGQTSNAYARRNVEFGIGNEIKNWDISLTGIVGQGNKSDRTDIVSQGLGGGGGPGSAPTINASYQSFAGNSRANPMMLNLKVLNKGFSFKTIFDNYETTLHNGTDSSTGKWILSQRAFSITSEIKYDAKLSKKITLTPAISYIRQDPKTQNLSSGSTYSQTTAERMKAGMLLVYNPSRKINITAGSELFKDKAVNSRDSIQTTDGYITSISYNNYAFFTQMMLKHRLANVILGARYDHNSKYGKAFVPRVGLTKKIDRWNFKLLYSGSFRAPTIQNIVRGVQQNSDSSQTSGINPEKTFIIELETGYQITRDMVVTLNLFQSDIKDPIVYNSDLNFYSNGNNAGTRGLEAQWKWKKSWGYLDANYSFYSVNGLSKISSYTTRQFTSTDAILPSGSQLDKSSLLAFPTHKATINGSVNILKNVSVSPTIILYGPRYGYELQQQSQGTFKNTLVKLDATMLANIFVYWKTPLHGLDGGVGVSNVFNNAYNYLSPYFTVTGSYPSMSREFLFKLSYNLNFNSR
ncbi:MAG TPA: TonB-dependent receptor plug domain-containing protein [Cyclobacteriaceae bacterium]|jgi:outer membrane receptor for ferrienterochelin and colicin|nr:TonB-dependent receptor plug domain-containing protein [Cyclobacteriaceae bacterium]